MYTKTIISIIVLHLFFQLQHAFAIDTSSEEKTCAELGFKPKTEKFANCVIELYSRKGKPSNSVSTKPITKRTGDGSEDDRTCQKYGFKPGEDGYAQCRMQIDNARKQAAAEQARYQAEVEAYEKQAAAANRQRERERNIKMMELGLGIMGGGGSGRGSKSNLGAPPIEPSSHQNIYLPNGRMITCRTNGTVTNCF